MNTTVKRASKGYILIIACLIVLLALSLFGAFRSITLVDKLQESRASDRAKAEELEKQIDQFEKCKDTEPNTEGCEEPVATNNPPPAPPEQGPPGEMGPVGPGGSPGPPGRPGSTGPRGPTGAEGEDGETIPGPPGEPGSDATGAPGRPGSDSTVPGPQGATGEKGATGDKGEKGEKGDTGATGKDGAPGKDSTVPGPPGKDGRDATFTVDTLTCDAPDGQYVDGLTLTRDQAGDLALTCQYADIRGRG